MPASLRSSFLGVTRTPVELHLKLLGRVRFLPGPPGPGGPGGFPVGYPGGPAAGHPAGGPLGFGGEGGRATAVAASARISFDHMMVLNVNLKKYPTFPSILDYHVLIPVPRNPISSHRAAVRSTLTCIHIEGINCRQGNPQIISTPPMTTPDPPGRKFSKSKRGKHNLGSTSFIECWRASSAGPYAYNCGG